MTLPQDYDFIKFLISLLTEYYPDILDHLLIFEMPRLLSGKQGVWRSYSTQSAGLGVASLELGGGGYVLPMTCQFDKAAILRRVCCLYANCNPGARYSCVG